MIKLIYNFLLALGAGLFVSYDIIYFEHYGLGLAILALVSSMYNLSSAISDFLYQYYLIECRHDLCYSLEMQ